MYKELAQYVPPKRKAVEVQADFRGSYVDALKAVNAEEKSETRRLKWSDSIDAIREATALRREILGHNACTGVHHYGKDKKV